MWLASMTHARLASVGRPYVSVQLWCRFAEDQVRLGATQVLLTVPWSGEDNLYKVDTQSNRVGLVNSNV